MKFNIQHRHLFNPSKVIEIYEKKDGVPIQYVCTSAINTGTNSCDIFYRESPHPKFGNRYFGLYRDPLTQAIMITNADNIENLSFEMIDVNGELYYSRDRWDYYDIPNSDVAIDGGRAYLKLTGNFKDKTIRKFMVKDGKFVESESDGR